MIGGYVPTTKHAGKIKFQEENAVLAILERQCVLDMEEEESAIAKECVVGMKLGRGRGRGRALTWSAPKNGPCTIPLPLLGRPAENKASRNRDQNDMTNKGL
jgi:hypothetical protein